MRFTIILFLFFTNAYAEKIKISNNFKIEVNLKNWKYLSEFPLPEIKSTSVRAILNNNGEKGAYFVKSVSLLKKDNLPKTVCLKEFLNTNDICQIDSSSEAMSINKFLSSSGSYNIYETLNFKSKGISIAEVESLISKGWK
ncbi:MAG: hypothetical protein COV57_03145 [Candidatus Liptonbacteria bacterium CG11_big_fil_rev_8_21_14_0_20_35_14]|uniref:Uncharacterized protein n=1 Tax=Candidatus Liptonbacteria bacterium CG11_big_fil_rev_8_21_14_0_20_35_14 TaxID=1974634 RepID=A0A2H0N714_9BACT|nr:MAG: hypothetical protein COV57_03145 [Candidatus Liptonbacteria bacterium CG11_big_fil_rev_8_21_14_0_20_35_14]PJB52574.1 MAG: hypothetical protein CO099_11970 [Bdellovibrio sp. CG_4_9_14_3_um_filter_39_7]